MNRSMFDVRCSMFLSFLLLFAVSCWLFASPASATALSANRDTKQIKSLTQISLTVKAAEIIYAGAMVSVDANGEAVNATDTATDQVVGRAAEKVDNTVDGHVIAVDVGIFGWAKSGTITDANIGDIVYVVDNQTVATADPGNACIAGVVVEQDSSYAYVDTAYLPRTAGAFTTLSASGAASLASTLDVTGAQTNRSTLKVAGAVEMYSTLALTGVGTFTAQPIFNAGIDVNEDVDIDFDATDEEVDVTTSSYAAKLFRIYSSSSNPSTSCLLSLDMLANGDADATFLKCLDNSSAETKFSIGPDGNTAVAGTLAVTGLSTLTGNAAVDEVDSATATALLLGKATATSVTIGASDINTLVNGTFQPMATAYVQLTATSRTCTSADYGKVIIVNTNAAVAITLPANGAAAGSWIEFMVHGSASDDCAPTVSAATVDTLIGPNDVDLDSVTWGTGHRIGAQAKVISDGTSWHVQNLGGTTMTYTD